MFTWHTAGESHGKGVLTLICGLPAGLEIEVDFINRELSRRQRGFGSGERMELERDQIEILSGIRWGKTIGSPIAILVKNRDYSNWERIMNPEGSPPPDYAPITVPRPGHADLAGMVKYRLQDIRPVIERASARETVGRCVAGALAKILLKELEVKVGGFVESIGPISLEETSLSLEERLFSAENSPLRIPGDRKKEQEIISMVERVREGGDTLGGTFVVGAQGVVPGLGTYVEAEKRLDARLASALMSIPAIKGVEIGEAFRSATLPGSKAHDRIFFDPGKKPLPFFRKTFFAGGLEGGVTVGGLLWVRCAMKPIPSLRRGLPTVDILTKEPVTARYERSDVCAVPRAVVVGEAMLALVLAQAYLEKLGGDSISEVKERFAGYLNYLEKFGEKMDGENKID